MSTDRLKVGSSCQASTGPAALDEHLVLLSELASRRGHDGLLPDQQLAPGPHGASNILLTDEFQRSRVLSRNRRSRRDRRRSGPLRLGGELAPGFRKLSATP